LIRHFFSAPKNILCKAVQVKSAIDENTGYFNSGADMILAFCLSGNRLLRRALRVPGERCADPRNGKCPDNTGPKSVSVGA